MSGELHQISVAIGELRAKADEGAAWRERTTGTLDSIHARLTEHGPRIDALEGRVNKMEPEVKSWTAAKYKAAGAVGVISVASAIAGFVGSKLGALAGLMHLK